MPVRKKVSISKLTSLFLNSVAALTVSLIHWNIIQKKKKNKRIYIITVITYDTFKTIAAPCANKYLIKKMKTSAAFKRPTSDELTR